MYNISFRTIPPFLVRPPTFCVYLWTGRIGDILGSLLPVSAGFLTVVRQVLWDRSSFRFRTGPSAFSARVRDRRLVSRSPILGTLMTLSPGLPHGIIGIRPYIQVSSSCLDATPLTSDTGGDDLKLKGWDTRQGFSQPTFTNKRFVLPLNASMSLIPPRFDAGITTIQSHPHIENLFAVGRYASNFLHLKETLPNRLLKL